MVDTLKVNLVTNKNEDIAKLKLLSDKEFNNYDHSSIKLYIPSSKSKINCYNCKSTKSWNSKLNKRCVDCASSLLNYKSVAYKDEKKCHFSTLSTTNSTAVKDLTSIKYLKNKFDKDDFVNKKVDSVNENNSKINNNNKDNKVVLTEIVPKLSIRSKNMYKIMDKLNTKQKLSYIKNKTSQAVEDGKHLVLNIINNYDISDLSKFENLPKSKVNRIYNDNTNTNEMKVKNKNLIVENTTKCKQVNNKSNNNKHVNNSFCCVIF